MTVDPLGTETEAPLTVTSMSLLGAAAGCCDAELLVWTALSARLQTGASREARRPCAASDRCLSTMADLTGAMMLHRLLENKLDCAFGLCPYYRLSHCHAVNQMDACDQQARLKLKTFQLFD